MITKEELLNGISRYLDNEVISVLSTSGKWVLGTALSVALAKYDNVITSLCTNPIVKSLGIINENGLIDEDCLLTALKENAEKYGTLQINVPLVGTLKFCANDVDNLKTYINEEINKNEWRTTASSQRSY